MFLHMLLGVAVTYQGEEIAQPNGEISWEEGQDPSACNGPKEDFDRISRDFERTPYHWDHTKNAGFSTGDKTWLPVSQSYLENNLAQQKNSPNSHYKIYQSLTALRHNSKTLREGSLDITSQNNVDLVRRKLNDDNLVFLFNLGEETENVDLSKHFENLGNLRVIIKANYNQKSLEYISDISLTGHAALILDQISE